MDKYADFNNTGNSREFVSNFRNSRFPGNDKVPGIYKLYLRWYLSSSSNLQKLSTRATRKTYISIWDRFLFLCTLNKTKTCLICNKVSRVTFYLLNAINSRLSINKPLTFQKFWKKIPIVFALAPEMISHIISLFAKA